jgi:hypothetical protein
MPLHQSTQNVRAIIEQNRRSTEFLQLTDIFIKKPESVTGLVELAVSEDVYPYPQYASQLLLHVARKNNKLIESGYNDIVDCFLNTVNTSVQRNLLGVLLCFPLKEYKEGELLNNLFSIINNPDSKPGLTNYAVHKLSQYLKVYPELKNEMEQSLELKEKMIIKPVKLRY